MTSRHSSDTGPFTLVPIWVLDLPISHLALRLYAVHADYADRTGAHYRGRKALADRLGVSLDGIDRAHRELVHQKALTVEHRRDAKGDPAPSLYIVRRTDPGVAAPQRLPSRTDAATGSRTTAATGSRTDAALTSSKDFRNLNNHARVREAAPVPSGQPLSDAERQSGSRRLRALKEDRGWTDEAAADG